MAFFSTRSSKKKFLGSAGYGTEVGQVTLGENLTETDESDGGGDEEE